MLNKSDILEQVVKDGMEFPPLTLTADPAPDPQADLVVTACWKGQTARFVAQVQKLSTPKALRQGIADVGSVAGRLGDRPMLIAPYLAPARLEELQEASVSGLDFCGNGVIVVPGQWLVMRSGKPNLFPQSVKLRNIYRGKNSLVARAFLIQPQFERVKDVMEFLTSRGGGVAFSTVSKTLSRLGEDLIISRSERIRLLQPESLMDKLLANYKPPDVTGRLVGKSPISPEMAAAQLSKAAMAGDQKLVVTGAASATKLAVMAREPILSLYCSSDPASLVAGARLDFQVTDRFPNLELLRTRDARVYFDPREQNGLPWASPVQTWLELATGDKRQKDAAQQVREGILAPLGRTVDDATP